MPISSTCPAQLREMVYGAYSAAAEKPQEKHAFPLVGSGRRSAAEAQAGMRLNPDNVLSYANLTGIYIALNRPEEAKPIFEQALERKLEHPILYNNRYLVAFLEGDEAEMQRLVAGAVGKPGTESSLLATFRHSGLRRTPLESLRTLPEGGGGSQAQWSE
jgi:tetratricopeptide (TPR) repeat protein